MADIPPNIVGSSAQAGYQQSNVAKSRDAERADQTHAARTGVKSIDDAGTTIETGDDDTAVFTDAEGAGGQGRHAEDESGEAHPDEAHMNDSSDGLSTDGEGNPHLDLQA